MKKVLFAALLILGVGATALAQQEVKLPKYELFGGYSQYLAGAGVAGQLQLPSNGVQVDFTRVVTSYFRVAGDFNAQFADHIVNLAPLAPGAKHYNSKELLGLFGPEATYRALHRFDIFGHYLIGLSYGRDNHFPPPANFHYTTWAYALGGGVDLKMGRRVSARLLEWDWITTHYPVNAPEAQDNWRLASGFVFRFGN